MPTISELPPTNTVSAADEVPVSQGGAARAVSVGALLASTQPAIIVESPALIGRTSVGPGGPEQINLGAGLGLETGTLVANGLDHAGFPVTASLFAGSDLVISNQGSPMLMQASMLRGLFSAGQNIAIDPNGVISAATVSTTANTNVSSALIGALPTVAALASQDLVAVSQGGSNYAIAYSNLLGGVTIDQVQAAGPVSDTDAIWAAQGSNVMASQSFSAIWIWIEAKLSTYKIPVVEVVSSIALDTTVHNGRILICSQPVTLTPLPKNMGSGFQCTVINASTGNVTLDSGFVTSSGSMTVSPRQSASLCCVSYSGGTISFATISGNTAALATPGQPTSLTYTGIAATTISLSWQAPATGGAVATYLIQYRVSGSTSWTTSTSGSNATTYQLMALLPGTSYDILVEGQNPTGSGPASAIVTVVTSTIAQIALPLQISGVGATALSSSSVRLAWSGQTGATAATNFTVQYQIANSSSWVTAAVGTTATTATISNLQPATGYNFLVIGTNSAGSGPASAAASATTFASTPSVTSITWNLSPSGTYTHSSGAIGANAHVTPAASPIQFGFSLSSSTPPSSWTAAVLVNTDLWGAYIPTPATAGSWYTWAEGIDGSAPTVSPSPFLVQ